MENRNFTTTVLVDQTPWEVYNAIIDITGWWTENVEGNWQNQDDEFQVRFKDLHFSRQKLIEVIRGKKIVWLVTESNLSFISDKGEWTGTKISFEISDKDGKSQLLFAHLGLVPPIECYGACSNAWNQYLHHSLYSLIRTGKGHPDKKQNDTKVEVPV